MPTKFVADFDGCRLAGRPPRCMTGALSRFGPASADVTGAFASPGTTPTDAPPRPRRDRRATPLFLRAGREWPRLRVVHPAIACYGLVPRREPAAQWRVPLLRLPSRPRDARRRRVRTAARRAVSSDSAGRIASRAFWELPGRRRSTPRTEDVLQAANAAAHATRRGARRLPDGWTRSAHSCPAGSIRVSSSRSPGNFTAGRS